MCMEMEIVCLERSHVITGSEHQHLEVYNSLLSYVINRKFLSGIKIQGGKLSRLEQK